jgi:hypothetical protein
LFAYLCAALTLILLAGTFRGSAVAKGQKARSH